MGKWQTNNNFKRKFWPGYLVLHNSPEVKKSSENIKKITNQASAQIAVAHTSLPKYALDFHSPTFWNIRVQELHRHTNEKDIRLFFEDFEKVDDVILTVKDADNPCIDEKSFLILEVWNYTRKIHARFFWAILPREIKEPYVNTYQDHLERMTQIFSDVNKWFFAEDY